MKVAIDAGHGYNTAGKRSAKFLQTITHTFDGHTITVKKGEQFREHVANAGVAFYLAAELTRCGVEVFKSAWDDFDGTNDTAPADAYTDVTTRQKAIRAAKCDYSISCHFNAYGDGVNFNAAQGVETLYHTDAAKVRDGMELAQALQSELVKVYPAQKNRGIVGGSSWGMCNSAGMNVKAAAIVECAFMTNQFEAENYFTNPAAWKAYAVGIAKGFCKYVGIKYVEEPQPQPTPAEKKIYRVQVGAYTVRANAEAQLKKIKAAGFDAFIVETTVKA